MPFPGNLPNPGIESRSLDCRRTFYQLSQKESPHHLPEFAQVHVHCIGDAVQPSHPLPRSSPSALDLSQQQGLFQWVIYLYRMTKILELQLQQQSFQPVFRVDVPKDWLVWSPCCPRDSQESSLAPQFEGICSLAFCLLYSPALTTVHDHWEDHKYLLNKFNERVEYLYLSLCK